MGYFHVHHRLLLLSVFFIVSTLATEVPTSSPGPSPTLHPVFSPSAEPELSPTPSPSPSLIQDGVPLSPSAGSEDGKVSPSDAPGSLATEVPTYSPGRSPNLIPVSSPNAEPTLSPTSSSTPPSPPAGSEESPEGPDGELPVSPQSDAPESDTADSDSESDSDSDSDSEPEQETANAIVEVKKVCESTDYPALCINTIDPVVESKTEVSLDTVLGASINATSDLAKATQKAAKKLAENPETPPEVASLLKVCQVSYDDAVDNFEKAVEAYDTRDVGTMNSVLSAVITEIGDCNDEFSSLNIPSPIAEFSEKLTNMTSNCLAIISLVQY